MKKDAFSQCHPAVNFVYFLFAIGFAVVFQHPAYLLAAALASGCYCLLLMGRRAVPLLLGAVPMFVLISLINPLFNTYGVTVLFTLFGRSYTFEALVYGMVIGGIFLVMLLLFGCYSQVMTSDKFTSLFGSMIPSLSLLLVMVLRMIPNLARKGSQISGARNAIGKGISGTNRDKLSGGMTVLSALTDWALEGSIVTADSMRSRGYGSAKRSSFQIYRFTRRDAILLALILILAALVVFSGGKDAVFTPEIIISPLNWGFPIYCCYLLIPTAMHIKEAVVWHILRSEI